MLEPYDFSWSINERQAPEYKAFDLVGEKGVVNWYPTVKLNHPEDFYTQEEALLSATVASNAPYMLRLLRKLAHQMEMEAAENRLVKIWREEILKEISEATGEVRRT